MTLLARTTNRATRINRHRQMLAETRMDEIVKVAGIADDYGRADRAGDLQVEAAFARVYQLMDDDEERQAVAHAFAVWQRTERDEERVLTGSVDESVDLLKTNNDLWLDDGCGPDGRAA